MAKVRTAAELGEALKKNEDHIEIEGDLARKIVKIRATGKIAWMIAFGAIAVAAGGLILAAPTGGTTAVVSGFAAPAAVGILGGSVTAAAISVAVAAGSAGALTSLRKYGEVKREDRLLVLRKR